MKKKKLLFVIDSLSAAGGEKSLVTLLSELDYDKYDVDLQLFSYGGEFQRFIPSEVNLLPPIAYLSFLSGNNKGTLRMWLSRVFYSIWLRVGNSSRNMTKARKWWISSRKCIPDNLINYDAAIAYSQCLPTFYVIEKVHATQKLAWVNCIYHLEGYEKEWQWQYYESIGSIVLVSENSLQHFLTVYPEFKERMVLMSDLISVRSINRLSEEDESYKDNTNIRLLTVARLDKRDKGYDITLEACKILRDRGVDFKWYAIGRGPYREEMERYIEANGLQDFFIFLGTTPNPYPYIKDCTIYVQTSRHEGFGLSIAEARILNRPVVTTEFDSVYNQMVPGKNGLVVPIDATAVADAIQKLLEDKNLYDSIVQYQEQEKKGNLEEIEKFYQLIES